MSQYLHNHFAIHAKTVHYNFTKSTNPNNVENESIKQFYSITSNLNSIYLTLMKDN